MSVATEELRPGEQAPYSWAIPLNAAVTFVFLYLISLALGLYRLGSRPPSEYNWEAYAMRGLLRFIGDPTANVLKVNEGLMTTSGDSAVFVGPAWLTTKIFGESFFSLRLAGIVIAALAVPLTWILGRILWSDSVGLCAALIVATSQGFLFYARTGTIVGMSIAPALLGFLILWKLTSPDTRRWWIWLTLLQVILIGHSYFYSPIRFLWPIAVALLATEFVLRSGSRKRFLISLGITTVTLPIALLLLLDLPTNSPVDAVKRYYNGGGEQIFRINDSRGSIVGHLPVKDEAERAELEHESSNSLTIKFIRANADDLANLLLDRKTKPVITDYWNPTGRLYSRSTVPLFLLSMPILLWSFFKSPKSRLMLALFWGSSLPILLTSNVHVGRMVFIIPLLALLVVMPIEPIIRLVARVPVLHGRNSFQRWAPVGLSIAVVVLAAVPSLRDWTNTQFDRQRSTFVSEQISRATREQPTPQLAYVFGDLSDWDLESIRVSVLRIELKGEVRFIDVATGETFDSGPISLLYHGLLTALENPAAVPGYCTTLYVVESNVVEQFQTLTQSRASEECGAPLKTLMLPS